MTDFDAPDPNAIFLRMMSVEQVKAAIEDAKSRRPYRGHIRVSTATYARVRQLSWDAADKELPAPWPSTSFDSVDLVIDDDVLDGVLRVAEHPSVRDRPIGDLGPWRGTERPAYDLRSGE